MLRLFFSVIFITVFAGCSGQMEEGLLTPSDDAKTMFSVKSKATKTDNFLPGIWHSRGYLDRNNIFMKHALKIDVAKNAVWFATRCEKDKEVLYVLAKTKADFDIKIETIEILQTVQKESSIRTKNSGTFVKCRAELNKEIFEYHFSRGDQIIFDSTHFTNEPFDKVSD